MQANELHLFGLGGNAIKALRHHPTAILHEGPMSRADYLGRIAHSVVLLPYDRDAYRWRSSGVYLEAKCLGAPVIVPAGTWMAEEVRAFGNGVVFEQYSSQEIIRCIAMAHADLFGLRARAATVDTQVRRQHGADRFVDAVESLAARL